MKSTPKVSVVMSTYNRCQDLPKTVASIEEQNYQNLEIIIVNDSSVDGTRKFLQKLSQDPKFVIINNIKNKGLQASLNIGIHKASGKYIARIDDHDIWIDNEKISKQIFFLEHNPKIGLLGTSYMTNGKVFSNPLSDKGIRRQMLFRCPYCHVSVVFPKKIWEELGGYNESLRYAEDWEFWLRIGQHYKLANLSDTTVKVEDSDDGLSKKYYLKQLPQIRKITKDLKMSYDLYFLSIVYHNLVAAFFKVFPPNGLMQKLMHRVFRLVFFKSNDQ